MGLAASTTSAAHGAGDASSSSSSSSKRGKKPISKGSISNLRFHDPDVPPEFVAAYADPLQTGAYRNTNANTCTFLGGVAALVLVIVGMAFPTFFWSTIVEKECPVIAQTVRVSYYESNQCEVLLGLPTDLEFSYAWDSMTTTTYSYTTFAVTPTDDYRTSVINCNDIVDSAVSCVGRPFSADNCLQCMYMRPGRGDLPAATIMASVGYGVFFLFSVPLISAVAAMYSRSHRAMDAIERADEENAAARLARWTKVQLDHGRDEEGLNASHESLLSRSGSEDRVSRHSASASSASSDESSSSSSSST